VGGRAADRIGDHRRVRQHADGLTHANIVAGLAGTVVTNTSATPAASFEQKCKKPVHLDKKAYNGSNVIERTYWAQDFRRRTMHYNKLARKFLYGACLSAAMALWL
jgi:hypothetical protein